MQRFAYGHLDLKPWEFWHLTLDEYNHMVESRLERMKYERSLLAAHALIPRGSPRRGFSPRRAYNAFVGDRKVDIQDSVTSAILKGSRKRAGNK